MSIESPFELAWRKKRMIADIEKTIQTLKDVQDSSMSDETAYGYELVIDDLEAKLKRLENDNE